MITSYTNSNLPSASCDLPSPIQDSQISILNAESVTYSWKSIVYSANPIIGYNVQYRQLELEVDWTDYVGNPISQPSNVGETISIEVDSLNSGQLYEFRVRPITQDDCGKSWDNTLVKIKLPLLTPFTDPNFFTWIQPVDQAQTATPITTGFFQTATPIEDNTTFIPYESGTGFDISGNPFVITSGIPIILNRGEVMHFPASTGGTVLQADKNATVNITVRSLSSGVKYSRYESGKIWHLGTDFIFGAFRETVQHFHIYSLIGSSPVIEVYKQGVTENLDTLVTTLNGVGGSIVTFNHSDGSDVYSFRSNEPILIFHMSGSTNITSSSGAYDQKVVNPPALRVIMSSTRNAAISARFDGTTPSTSVSSIGNYGIVSVSREVRVVASGLPNQGPLYSGDSVIFDGNNLPIVGGPGADLDGTKQTLGQDLDTLIDRIRLPTDFFEGTWSYLKISSDKKFNVSEYDPTGTLVNLYSSNGTGPYELRIASPTPQNLFVSDQKSQFVAQTIGASTRDDDEISLW